VKWVVNYLDLCQLAHYNSAKLARLRLKTKIFHFFIIPNKVTLIMVVSSLRRQHVKRLKDPD